MNNNTSEKLAEITGRIIAEGSRGMAYHSIKHGEMMPSTNALKEIVELLRKILFPGYFGNSSLNSQNLHYYVGVNVDKVYRTLSEQIRRGLCFNCTDEKAVSCGNCDEESGQLTLRFLSRLPEISRLLSTDVEAAYRGDPAARNHGEVIFCYPAIKAMTNYRIAHELLKLGVPLIPRIITEMAHSETGIDIHPGARIGQYFTIDHGTGVVIGETTIIGNNVKIYQGVTLGAKSFPTDENGNPIKGIDRHPVVEDNVIIYAEATILGRVTIGKDTTIGGNVWITTDIPVGSKILQK
ncbi:MAG: serine acetyltransferase [Bacteroidetes bacterium GWF2_38_335]|nr:MAG: serine acetyltransferase [Bacteroidetes bacterium GWF2_38_335]OFY80021.1 MAG: serine acetyltransferase [Bacteroidetes bacterium RIFOXYA12_FULL_38_20]HBS85244.1 serine acetyltransferase [Bacteroidales bacterium]